MIVKNQMSLFELGIFVGIIHICIIWCHKRRHSIPEKQTKFEIGEMPANFQECCRRSGRTIILIAIAKIDRACRTRHCLYVRGRGNISTQISFLSLTKGVLEGEERSELVFPLPFVGFVFLARGDHSTIT